ncbi:helix-turn-helix domain-containing protein [Hymenobacter sp. CRA2]|uniref:helix-turn-helix domain-containing protein n=1 Tax=Hymenobacter sp. CRA2 TaxID=1955620 RepID=UPI00098F4523|nr:helix-turn-helix domain-containing protein [Hymenobacter sp. CRA2]OON68128.1 hypothetical protein B0919_15890 [Hymenobacter sp. CRA2]
MVNPFESINARLNNLEALALETLQHVRGVTKPADEVGGVELAQEVTRLSKARIYTLVSSRQIPHSKRGNKLYFNRAELLKWVNEGKRIESNVKNAMGFQPKPKRRIS